MQECVFDIEADGIDATKIHVVSVDYGGNIFSTNLRDKVVKLFSREDVIVIAHNSYRYDKPTLERLFKFKFKAKLVDTLPLSWYLYPERLKHGLEEWGEEFGIPKPKIDDWENLTYDEYKHRCEEDVKINKMLWQKIKKHLIDLYGSEKEAWRLIDYLMFKMDCAAEQERSKWRLDKPRAQKLQKHLQEEFKKAQEQLKAVMPKVPIMTTKTRPKKMYKQSGELSAFGEKWVNLLKEHRKHPESKSITYICGYEEPNPSSDPQIKNWLFSLGWTPCTFAFKRNKETNEVKQIPQVRMKNDDNEAILTPSVYALVKKVPELEALKNVGVIKHRLDVVTGFLRNVDEDGFIRARIKGLTNTLRFKHEEVVNLPGVDKPYGKDLRGCLIARDGYELLGSDMCSLEDRTKLHYLWDFDPEYVKQMMADDYDPHLDLALFAGAITEEDIRLHKEGVKKCALRKVYKAVNYACVYGAGGATVARSAGVSEAEGKKLVKAYWDKNWSVKAVADSRKVKTLHGQMWVFNEVSKLWYSLRYEKDIFSTTNQGTGVFCFDTWVKFFRSKRPQLTGQMHDEVILEVKKGYRKEAEALLKWAVAETNKLLKLNRELDIDVQFGDSYADIH